MVTQPTASLAQERDSSPAETSVLTAVLRRHMCMRTQNQDQKSEKLHIHKKWTKINNNEYDKMNWN